MDANLERELFARADRVHMRPGWAPERPGGALAPPKLKPTVWRYLEAKAALDEAADLDMEVADRRNVVLQQKIDGMAFPPTKNFVAAYQMVNPGEKARSHRHSAGALRLVIDTKPGMYTIVNGVRIDMAPGDVVLTPAHDWHGHSNESGHRGYWIDVLDVPFVQNNRAMSFAPYPEPVEKVRQADPNSPLRISPSSVFTGGRTGLRDIATGVMPTFGLYLLHQRAGETREMARSTFLGNLYSVISGQARFVCEGGLDETLGQGDIISIPARHGYTIEAVEETIVFRVTDEPIYRALGYFKLGAGY